MSCRFFSISSFGRFTIFAAAFALTSVLSSIAIAADPSVEPQVVELRGDAGGKRFDGIGIVNGGGATSVLLKDYPEPQRSQILDLVFKPKFGASVSALLIEIPGDANSTQGTMPSHMHARDDLNYSRGYMWWILREAKKRNPDITLDGAAWSAPGWLGDGKNFWSQDSADYYVKWLQGLRSVYGLEFDALGCRNEKGVSFEFVKMLRASLDANGFEKIKIHAFDNWPKNKFDFVKDLMKDDKARAAIDVLGAHTLMTDPASAEVREMAAKMHKPIWNTEEHVYKKGFDCAIGIVEAFNENFIRSGATKIVNWYDIAGVYPMEPYSEDPAMLLARSPWSGNYKIREALWGYAHYGQFTQVGWQYLDGGCGPLKNGGSFVTLKSPGDDFSVIIETKDAKTPQQIRFRIGRGLSAKSLCVWRSDAKEQFVRQADVQPTNGEFTITLEPESIYSLSTTEGQRKGSFADVPEDKPFPFPYFETFEEYSSPEKWGYLPRYMADIAGVFELAKRPDGKGTCLRQVVSTEPIAWAPEWSPYTVFGDERRQDYEVSAEIYLNPGDSAGVMGRVNDVGSGYGCVPKGYFMLLGADGECKISAIRGKKDKKKVVGDAEQQALIKKKKEEDVGGEKELGRVQLPDVGPGRWHAVKLRFEGETITAFVDEKQVLSVTDSLYSHGMAGLTAGRGKKRISVPYFDNILLKGHNDPMPAPSSALPGQTPIYGDIPQPSAKTSPVTSAAANAVAGQNAPTRIVLIGDSTVCEYPKTRPERGWGQFIEERFKPGTVKVINLAAAGRSTKTFIQEGRWKKALEEKPDYVLIQFGHNDSHASDRPESTDAATDYKEYLRRYVDESRAIGATPIFVTPMVRRTFEADGKLKDELQRYADAMKEVAAEKKAPVIDLHASSKEFYERIGPTAAAETANKKGDATHFNEKGARTMAELVMKELPTTAPKLESLLSTAK